MTPVSGYGADGELHAVEAPGRIYDDTYRAAAALPAAGAFTSPDPWPIPLGARRLSVLLSYDQDAAASSGILRVRIEWQFAEGVVHPDGILSADFATPTPYAVQAGYPTEQEQTPPDASLYAVPVQVFEVAPGAIGLVVRLAEGGDTSHPGTAAIAIAAGW